MKSVSFRYACPDELSSLLEEFRLMINDAIRIAVKEKPRNRFSLIELAYPRLKEYRLHSHYILSACEIAYSVYTNKSRKSIPYVRRAFLKLDNQSYQLNHLLLRIPTAPGNYIFLTLHASPYHLSYVDNPDLKRGSVTITERAVSVSFSRMVPMAEPHGYVGVDVNEKNVTISSTGGYSKSFTELKEVVEIKERYRELRAKIGKVTRQDSRINKQLYAKYGVRERNRTLQRIHRITKEIVECAQANQNGIKMEKLTGIGRLYRRGNGKGTSFRGRMNGWVFHQIQGQIEYKARWDGVVNLYVNPRGTSSYCPECGSHVVRLAERKLYCALCDKTWDRDALASKNIMAVAVPAARQSRGSCEGERDGGSNPRSRWTEVKLGDYGRSPG